MTKNVILEAEKREEDEKPKELRRDSYIPAVVYGSDSKLKAIKIKNSVLEKVYAKAGESSLVDLKINDEEPVKVIFKEIQRHPVKESFLHVDFFEVDMKNKITTEVPLNFVGEAKAVKEQGGIILKNMDTVEIECLPGDLIDVIDVDLSVLENLGESIKLEDLKLPENVSLVSQESTATIVHVVEPRMSTKEEEEEKEGEAKEEEKKEDDKEETKEEPKKEEAGKEK